MHIALLGIRGVPARYSGFETAAEEIGRRLVARGHRVTVYCRGRYRHSSHLGMGLVYLPTVRHKITETFVHTALSSLHLQLQPTDVAVIFNPANAGLLPLCRLRNIPVAMHVDGLEWQRAKWGPVAKRFELISERAAASWAHKIIADSRAMQEYYRSRYGVESCYIPYGAPIIDGVGHDRIRELRLRPREYHLVVARFEPENHIHTIVRGYVASRAQLPLVVVGGAPYGARYIADVHREAESDNRVRFVGAVWDQQLLDQLYSNALTYIHGHSVGGTNPSLLRAMGAGAPVMAYDVVFNREVLDSCGMYFEGPPDLAGLLEAAEGDRETALVRGRAGQRRAADLYKWDDVADGYEGMLHAIRDRHS